MARGLGDGLLRFCNGAWRDNDGDAVDIEEVVRCKDCKMEYGCLVAQWLGENGFCSYGEKQEV